MAAPMTASFPLPDVSPAGLAGALRQELLTDRERAITRLYRKSFPPVRRYIRRYGGTEQDAQDVFQDALVVFYERAVGGTLVLTAAPGTYLLSIARNLWHHERRRRHQLPADALPDDLDLPATEEPETETTAAVLDYVERLGEKCKQVLLAFYYFQQPLAQIATTHGYSSVRSATAQKFKCLERLRNAVRTAFAAETVDY